MSIRWAAARNLSSIGVAAVVAAGCGGGGGAASSGPSFDLAAGFANLAAGGVNAPIEITGTGGDSNLTGSGQMTQSIWTASTFNGAPAMMQTTTVTGTAITSGSSFPVDYSFTQYDSSSNGLLGFATNFNSVLEYDIPDSPIPLPSSVRAGDSGVLGTMSTYLDLEMTEVAGSIEVSYVVTAAPNNANAVGVELIERYTDALRKPGQVFQFDYTLTASGSMSLQSWSMQYPIGGTTATDIFTVE